MEEHGLSALDHTMCVSYRTQVSLEFTRTAETHSLLFYICIHTDRKQSFVIYIFFRRRHRDFPNQSYIITKEEEEVYRLTARYLFATASSRELKNIAVVIKKSFSLSLFREREERKRGRNGRKEVRGVAAGGSSSTTGVEKSAEKRSRMTMPSSSPTLPPFVEFQGGGV